MAFHHKSCSSATGHLPSQAPALTDQFAAADDADFARR